MMVVTQSDIDSKVVPFKASSTDCCTYRDKYDYDTYFGTERELRKRYGDLFFQNRLEPTHKFFEGVFLS